MFTDRRPIDHPLAPWPQPPQAHSGSRTLTVRMYGAGRPGPDGEKGAQPRMGAERPSAIVRPEPRRPRRAGSHSSVVLPPAAAILSFAEPE